MRPAPEIPWQRLSDVIADSMGLNFPSGRWAELERGLESAAREMGLDGAPACAARLLQAPPTKEELQVLASHLTVGETYFFRDPRVFDALREVVIPRLAHGRRSGARRLRLWSAGCCTGEEPYSLAILVREALPDLADWHVTITATDINAGFLRKAAAGVYGKWSFRGVPDLVRERYFVRADGGRYAVRQEIRRMVTFGHLNLAGDSFPSVASDTNAMDVILCRNVLMYFTAAQTQRVARQLHQALGPGGVLVVSPSEASQALFPDLSPLAYPGAVLYQRDGEPKAVRRPQAPASQPHVRPTAILAADVATIPPRVRQPPPPPLSRLAREAANRGALDEALIYCERWTAAEKVNPAAHYLQAMVQAERGDARQARACLQRTLYLAPSHVMAHVALGNLAHGAGLESDARRHYGNALRAALRLDPQAEVADADGLTAGRIAETTAALAGKAAA